jgi:hypothetical protein
MAADRMARRLTPSKVYSLGPLVKVTLTEPVKGLAITLRAALLNLELMGSIWFCLFCLEVSYSLSARLSPYSGQLANWHNSFIYLMCGVSVKHNGPNLASVKLNAVLLALLARHNVLRLGV